MPSVALIFVFSEKIAFFLAKILAQIEAAALRDLSFYENILAIPNLSMALKGPRKGASGWSSISSKP